MLNWKETEKESLKTEIRDGLTDGLRSQESQDKWSPEHGTDSREDYGHHFHWDGKEEAAGGFRKELQELKELLPSGLYFLWNRISTHPDTHSTLFDPAL